MSKAKLTKGTGLSLGSLEKPVMPELKTELVGNEQRTTIFLSVDLYKAAKQFALMNDMTFKQYLNDLVRADLTSKNLL
ncbi:hypothetical protein [Caviibacterium pharyngocola]|uniref:Uncharacterized protein n=1 Tax=Caviibacterium pharyngocola TaxID=28159 RepID=A0A2M8RUQ9_9PAST|nr:hypothetical protein [Caviibacterium pharyngocola]PJG82636.1 hypothetical protein CVP04_08185 [Caviibacterium pharyngocola]